MLAVSYKTTTQPLLNNKNSYHIIPYRRLDRLAELLIENYNMFVEFSSTLGLLGNCKELSELQKSMILD